MPTPISNPTSSYVGTLHEISSENSTVALENVTSYGTEGRRREEEIPPNLESIYEYIVFRGSDVKDLRIEEGPKEVKKPEPPKMPDDPAILGVSLISQLSFKDAPLLLAPNLFPLMKHIGCKIYKPRARNRVDISVAFLLRTLSSLYILYLSRI